MYSRRNTAILAILIALLLVISAFRSGEPHGGVRNPDEIAAQSGATSDQISMVHAPEGMFGCIKLCPPSGLFWSTHNSAVLVYRRERQGAQSPASADLSWNVIGEFNGQWYGVFAGSMVGNSQVSGSAGLISVTSMPVPPSSLTFRYGTRAGFLLTVGVPLSAAARMLEVRYDTGQSIRQPLIVSKTGETAPFGIVTRAKAVCSMRLFDASETLLQQIDASNDPLLAMQIQRDAPGGCE